MRRSSRGSRLWSGDEPGSWVPFAAVGFLFFLLSLLFRNDPNLAQTCHPNTTNRTCSSNSQCEDSDGKAMGGALLWVICGG